MIGAFGNFELNPLALEGSSKRAFYPEEQGVPAYDKLIFVAKSARLDDLRLPRLLDAIEAGTLYLLNHPDESAVVRPRNLGHSPGNRGAGQP